MTAHERFTARLLLTPTTAGDVDALFAVHADLRVWQHFPSGRHTARAHTADLVGRCVADWERDGLGYWVVRSPVRGQLLGLGGCARRGPVWNLHYRLTPEAQGRGYGTEVARAGLEAAGEADPDVPVTAYLLEQHRASARVAEHVGLSRVWSGPDLGNPDPDAVRLVYADRALSPEQLDAIVETPA